MRDWLGRLLASWRVKEVLPHVRGRLLDIGCGANQLVRRYGRDGVGVDVRQWGTVDLVVSDTSQLPFAPQEFDVVTFLASLNHIPNRQKVLAEARRLLKADGRVIVTMIPPVLSGVWHFLRRPWDADQHERGMKEGEVYGLTRSQVRQILRDAGFEVVQERRFMLGVNRLTIARKATPE
ncbi:MAG: class I SAM-dependent methyltransferase [Phycisphaerae bacterium]|nr:class I SAM-dependent methyltransferase [Phycisphaerae bacterium]